MEEKFEIQRQKNSTKVMLKMMDGEDSKKETITPAC